MRYDFLLKSIRSFSIMRILNVAEKNDAAKNISIQLSNGNFQKREGLSVYNKIYEFDYNFMNRPAKMSMTSVSGHLMEFVFPPEYKHWNSVDPISLFDAPIRKNVADNFLKIKETLIREIRQSEYLIIWTDCDREGENIGMEIVQVCRSVKPNIRVLRAQFSEITKQAVSRSMQNLLEIDEKVSNAVDVRQELDLRIGASFTRVQTLRLRRAFPTSLDANVISYGPCQFPTLGFVVERFREVDQFVPEPFWKLQCNVNKNGSLNEFHWCKGSIFDKDVCEAFYSALMENPNGYILNVVKKPKSRWRPAAMDTVELEKLSSTKLRITAKETMNIAEKLYTQGYISYPRTETNIFPKEINLRNLVQEQSQDSRWSDFTQKVLSKGPNPRNGKKSDKAHPPIHPLKSGNNLQGNEARVYELIARHFLACVSEDAKAAETQISLIVGLSRSESPAQITEESGELFECKGLSIIEKNYLEVYPYEKWSDKIISDFDKGEWFAPVEIEMKESSTRAPPLLTEAELIALMDKHGIGTDATHAEHIETIKKRLYIGVQDNKFLVPGQIGMGLIEGYDSMGLELSKPNLRAKMENDLRLICEGTRSPEDVLEEHKNHYKALLREITRKIDLLDEAVGKRLDVDPQHIPGEAFGTNQVMRKCPSCNQADVVLKKKKNNPDAGQNDDVFFLSCLGYPACRYAVWMPKECRHAKPSSDKCPKCHQTMLALTMVPGTRLPSGLMAIPNEDIKICIYCDFDFREAFQVRLPSSSSQNSLQPRPQPNTTNANSRSNVSQPQATFAVPTTPASLLSVHNPPTRRPLQNNTLLTNSISDSLSSMRNDFASSHSSPAGPANDQQVNCFCAMPTVLKTVRKEGPNTGRQFYCCGEMTGQSCNFFQWADESEADNLPNSYRNNNNANSANPPKCMCGQTAKMRVVQKESANKGRQFYTCPKRMGADSTTGCDFFEWSDTPGGQTSSGSSSHAHGSSTFPKNPPKAKTKPKVDNTNSWPPVQYNNLMDNENTKRAGKRCGICREVGHTRNKCPQR